MNYSGKTYICSLQTLNNCLILGLHSQILIEIDLGKEGKNNCMS